MRIDVLLQRITIDPEICHGKPCIRGMRYPVEYMMEYLAGGDTLVDLISHFPDLCAEDFFACDEYSRIVLARTQSRRAR